MSTRPKIDSGGSHASVPRRVSALRSALHPWKRQLLAWRVRALSWLRRHGLPCHLCPRGAAFDDYKRARSRIATEDLSRLHVPHEAGLVSIVLPVCNGQRYLREALDSIRAQDYSRFELIVVDDGSTDETPAILAEYARQDARISVIAQSNERLPRALSNGLRAARGEFFTWTSDDNRLKPEFLSRMVACLQRQPSWDMIYANEDMIDAQGRPLLNSPCYPLYQHPLNSHHLHFPSDVSKLNGEFDNIVGAAFLYRARVRWLLGDYSDRRFGLEDYDYWMRVNALLTLRHSDFPEPIYDYRFHEESLTSRGEAEIRRNQQQLIDFDAFRRSVYLRPLAWRIEASAADPQCRQVAKELEALAIQGGRMGSDSAKPAGEASPAVYVKVVARAEEAARPPAGVPESALSVLVIATDGALPATMPKEWALCLAVSGDMRPPRLAEDRQGWLLSRDLGALLSAIDIRARSDYLARMDRDRSMPSAVTAM